MADFTSESAAGFILESEADFTRNQHLTDDLPQHGRGSDSPLIGARQGYMVL
jgi:hypothetical protein